MVCGMSLNNTSTSSDTRVLCQCASNGSKSVGLIEYIFANNTRIVGSRVTAFVPFGCAKTQKQQWRSIAAPFSKTIQYKKI